MLKDCKCCIFWYVVVVSSSMPWLQSDEGYMLFCPWAWPSRTEVWRWNFLGFVDSSCLLNHSSSLIFVGLQRLCREFTCLPTSLESPTTDMMPVWMPVFEGLELGTISLTSTGELSGAFNNYVHLLGMGWYFVSETSGPWWKFVLIHNSYAVWVDARYHNGQKGLMLATIAGVSWRDKFIYIETDVVVLIQGDDTPTSGCHRPTCIVSGWPIFV